MDATKPQRRALRAEGIIQPPTGEEVGRHPWKEVRPGRRSISNRDQSAYAVAGSFVPPVKEGPFQNGNSRPVLALNAP